MNLEAMMTLQGMLTIALVIAAAGTAVTHVFRNADSPYLVTITGTRPELVMLGAALWATAVGLGAAVLLAGSALVSPMIGVALFFGVEAVALDICAHRTRYVRISTPVVKYVHVRVTPPFDS